MNSPFELSVSLETSFFTVLTTVLVAISWTSAGSGGGSVAVTVAAFEASPPQPAVRRVSVSNVRKTRMRFIEWLQGLLL
jgi:hypothetical protein